MLLRLPGDIAMGGMIESRVSGEIFQRGAPEYFCHFADTKHATLIYGYLLFSITDCQIRLISTLSKKRGTSSQHGGESQHRCSAPLFPHDTHTPPPMTTLRALSADSRISYFQL